MHPETQLALVAAFAGFLLKTSVGFCICWALARVAIRPRGRFVVWFVYLFVACAYWLWLLATLVPHPVLPASGSMSAALPAAPPLDVVHVTDFWVTPLSFLLRALAILYILALASLLFLRIKKHLHLRWILQFTYKPPQEIETLFRPIAESLGVADARLLMLSGIHSPATFGWVSPIVLVPPLCLEQDSAELRDILRHELQHIRRRDFVFNSIASFCRALLFFHPAAWLAMRNLSLESELACDLAVVGDSPEKRATYAESLVRFARMRVAGEPAPWNLDFVGSSSQLKVRIRSVLAAHRKLPGWLLGLRAASGAALLVAFLAAAPSLWVVLSYQQPSIAFAGPPVAASPTHIAARHRGLMRASVRTRPSRSGVTPGAHVLGSPAPVDLEIAAEASPDQPRRLRSALSSSDPALVRRGNAIPKPPHPAPGGTILLSNSASSESDSLSRGASAGSAVLAIAGEAARVASHGREK